MTSSISLRYGVAVNIAAFQGWGAAARGSIPRIGTIKAFFFTLGLISLRVFWSRSEGITIIELYVGQWQPPARRAWYTISLLVLQKKIDRIY